MVMFEERAYWNEAEIDDVMTRFRKGIAAGSNGPSVTAEEATALISSGVVISETELDLLCMQSPGLRRCGRLPNLPTQSFR